MPAPPHDDRRGASTGGWRHWARRRLPLESETATFILANALDVFLTVLLLYRGTHGEGNPLAKWFLDRWGVAGMVYFKFGMVAFVCVIAQVIARRRPATARRLLYATTAMVGAVVAYSLAQFLRTG